MGPEQNSQNETIPLLIDVLQTRAASPRRGRSSPAKHESAGCLGEVLPQQGSGLSVVFATLCIVDLFGVFPIIALPRAIINCGWIGIPLALAVFSVQIYTARLLGRCWVMAERINPLIMLKSRYPYAALAEEALGLKASRLVSFLLDITVFGASIPNLLVASQNLQLIGLKMSHWNFEFSFCYWLVLVGIVLCPVMWLGSPKDMKWLAGTSVFTVASVGVLTWVTMITDIRDLDTQPVPQLSWEAIAVAYGVIAFQFDIHPMILTVQVDMERKNELGKAITCGFLVTCSLFLTTTIIAMWRYGSTVTPNLLQGMPANAPLYADVLLVTLQICLSMVVGGCALYQDVEDKLGIPREFNWKRCLVRSSLVMLGVALGLTVPRFDLIMGLIGGALTGPLMFIFPPLFYLHLSRNALSGVRRHPVWMAAERLLLLIVILLGVAATIAATYFSLVETVQFAHFTPPCIVNVTSASRAWINDAFSYDL
ncbi:Hypothetical predicted protein [Cloeon dipterum]|uniref:Amino acid transporter transmembrane domain-containing protein n=1 Tax=Cloeon dipterum TaxID=197152 RepID=A0A8S1D1V5_9INSE|nr:Hypothetical predicted protein [Cloeon dipterum]